MKQTMQKVLDGASIGETPGRSYVVIANFGLHHIKGNKSPYFSVTGEVWHANAKGEPMGRDCISCGAIHDLLSRVFPKLQPVIDLHLADIDGAPMHAESNGIYWAAGAAASEHAPDLPVWDSKYHGASGSSGKSPQECLEIAAKHFRISLDDMREALPRRHDKAKRARADLAKLTEDMRPKWKAQAEAVISQFGLEPYGTGVE